MPVYMPVYRCPARGFTLVELVITLIILAILGTLGGAFVALPLEAYSDASRRAALTDHASLALARMERTVRAALPNSLRVPGGSGTVLELIPVVDAGLYRRDAAGGDHLDFTAADASFDVLGPISAANPGTLAVVVYNLSATGGSNNAYGGDNRAGLDTLSNTAVLDAAHLFPAPAPSQRFYVVDQPVTYICPGDGYLWRVSDYGFHNPQPTDLGTAPLSNGTAVRLAADVAACRFGHSPGSRSALVTLEITLCRDPVGDPGYCAPLAANPELAREKVRLLHQVHLVGGA